MDKTTIIGVILGVLAVGVGMILKGVDVTALFNPAAFLIIFAGTAAAVMIAFPASELKKVPALLKIIFKEQELPPASELIDTFAGWANTARAEGLLALETKLEEIEDPFLQNGMRLAIDGQSPDFIRDVLSEELDAMEDRHLAGAAIFTQAGTYAPTLGVLGAVVGLIAALGHMEDTGALGKAIAAAFVATLFGIFSGYVLWHPFANKLKQKSRQEIFLKRIIIEGVLSIQEGQSSMVIRDKLASYLPAGQREQLNQQEFAGELENA